MVNLSQVDKARYLLRPSKIQVETPFSKRNVCIYKDIKKIPTIQHIH